MKRTKILCLFLALLMLTAAFLAACSGGEEKEPINSGTAVTDPSGTPVTSAPEPETEAVDPDTVHDLPEGLDFGGADFVMYTVHYYQSLQNDEVGETLHDTQYDVKRYTEELLGVSIREMLGGTDDELLNASAYHLSGDTDIHVWMEYDREAFSHALINYYTPLSQTKYVDTSKKYWNPTVAEKLAVGDCEFVSLGSFQLGAFENVGCIFMNLTVAENVGVEVPFRLVKEGKWTLDAIAAYSETANYDVDGDGDMTQADSTTFGSSDHRQTLLNFMSGSDVPFMGKDENNLPCLLAFGNEKLINMMEWVKKMFFNPVTSVASKADVASMITTDMFTHDRQLFLIGELRNMRNNLQEMESVYAVLPIPKYDEAQKDYISRTKDTVFPMLLNNSPDKDMDSAVLEAMSARAYQYLIPALIHTSLQHRYNNDPRNVECIQICFDHFVVELSDMMLWSTFGDTPTWRLMYRDIAPASWLASVQNAAEINLAKSNANIQKLFEERDG
jgi:hypothetical protein